MLCIVKLGAPLTTPGLDMALLRAGLMWNLLVTMLMAIYFSGDYEGGC